LNWQNPPQPRGPFPGGGSQGGNGGRGGWGRRAEGDFLTDLVDETGGDMFNANKYSDMQSLLYTVAEELRHVYVIGFYPTNPKLDGRYRKINIQVANNTNVVVKYKRGYNAPTQQENSTTTGTGSTKSGPTQP
jgi:VWFA-related protein